MTTEMRVGCTIHGSDDCPRCRETVYIGHTEAAAERWMRRQRLKTPFRQLWHRLLRHDVGRYACFTCDMDLPR